MTESELKPAEEDVVLARLIALCGFELLFGCGFILWFLNTRDVNSSSLAECLVPGHVMFVVTLVCTGAMPRKPYLVPPLGWVSIPLGVLFNAFVTPHHNLLPIEMALWAVISTPGIALGGALGCLVYWLVRKSDRRTQPRF